MVHQQLPDLDFNPRERFRPATRAAFEMPVSLPRLTWRALLALPTAWSEVIDVSKWQPAETIDYPVLYAGGVLALVAKASESVTIQDGQFTHHWQNARGAGMGVMAYHFFRCNQGGIPQADYFWNAIQPMLDALGYVPPLWVDIETVDGVTSNSTRLARLKACLGRLDELAGLGRAGIYTSPGYANTYLSPAPGWINTYWHWIAHWTNASLPTQPTGWNPSQRKLWQYGVWDNHSWCTPVPGCVPDVDRNRFFGDSLALAEFIGQPEPLTLEQRVTALEAMAHTHAGWSGKE